MARVSACSTFASAMAEKKKKVKVHDQTVNSYGFVVLTSGIDLSRYQGNPVLLYNHDGSKLLGRVEELEVKGTEIWGVPVFNSKNEFAAEKEQEYNDDFLKGFSLGLEPKEYDFTGQIGFGDVPVVTKSELTEITLCAIPSNKNAVKLYGEKGSELTTADLAQIKLSINQNTTEMKNRAALIAALKLSADATDEQILDAVTKQNEKLQKAETDAAAAAELALTDKINLMVDTAVSDKKITAEQKPDFVKLAKLDFDGTKKILDGMKVVAGKPMELVHSHNPEKPEGVKGREAWTYDDWATKDSRGLQLMKKDDPEKFNTLLNAAKEAKRRG